MTMFDAIVTRSIHGPGKCMTKTSSNEMVAVRSEIDYAAISVCSFASARKGQKKTHPVYAGTEQRQLKVYFVPDTSLEKALAFVG